jgi:hypothetical protein
LKTRRCDNCVYAGTMHDGRRTVPICANTPEAPGEIVRIQARGVCRHWRRRRVVVRGAPPRRCDGDIRYIPLTKGKVAIVDAADYAWLSRWKWHAEESGPGRFYASRATPGLGRIGMHRVIMNPPKGMLVDHIDGNGLNNRRCNLRICTPQENAYNTRPACNKPRFKGVTPCGHLWWASVWHDGQEHELGLFDDEIQAALARDQKALELHGEFAYLNFPHIFRRRSD